MLKFRASVAWHLPSRGPGLSCSRGGGRTPRLPGAMEPPGNGAFDPDDGLGERTLFDLPEEVVESVLSLLPHTDVCRFGSTCKQALVAARSETVWRALLWRDFAVKAPNGASRQSYSSLHADGQLWRTMQWRPVECGGPSQLLKLASAPDDALVIGTVFSGDIICFDARDGSRWARLPNQNASICSVACLGQPGSHSVVVGGAWDGRVSIWMPGVRADRPVATRLLSECVQCVSVWEYRGALFVGAGDAAGTVRVWALPDWHAAAHATALREASARHQRPPAAGADGAATANAAGTRGSVDVGSSEQESSSRQWHALLCRKGPSVAWCMGTSPEGRYLGACIGTQLHVWDCAPACDYLSAWNGGGGGGGSEVESEESGAGCMRGPGDDTVRLVHMVTTGRAGKEQPASLAVALDASRLAVGLYTGVVKVWERQREAEVWAADPECRGEAWDDPGACIVRQGSSVPASTNVDSETDAGQGSPAAALHGAGGSSGILASRRVSSTWSQGQTRPRAPSVASSIDSVFAKVDLQDTAEGRRRNSPPCCRTGYQLACMLDLGLSLGKVSALQFVGPYLLVASPSQGGKVTAFTLTRDGHNTLSSEGAWSVPGPSAGCVCVCMSRTPLVARAIDHGAPLIMAPAEGAGVPNVSA